MNEDLVTLIAEKIISDVNFWIALFGLGGVIIGALIAILGNIIIFKMQNKQQQTIDTARKGLLDKMLGDSRFKDGRALETLCNVTGATPDECRRLLIEIEARGFKLQDDREGWGYIKNIPISER